MRAQSSFLIIHLFKGVPLHPLEEFGEGDAEVVAQAADGGETKIGVPALYAVATDERLPGDLLRGNASRLAHLADALADGL